MDYEARSRAVRLRVERAYQDRIAAKKAMIESNQTLGGVFKEEYEAAVKVLNFTLKEANLETQAEAVLLKELAEKYQSD